MADIAAFGLDTVVEVVAALFMNRHLHRVPHLFPVIGNDQAAVGQAPVVDDLPRAVAGECDAAAADILHRPVGIIAAAEHHARQIVKNAAQGPVLGQERRFPSHLVGNVRHQPDVAAAAVGERGFMEVQLDPAGTAFAAEIAQGIVHRPERQRTREMLPQKAVVLREDEVEKVLAGTVRRVAAGQVEPVVADEQDPAFLAALQHHRRQRVEQPALFAGFRGR